MLFSWPSLPAQWEPNPIILFVCPTLTDLIYCKRATKRLLEEKWDEDIQMCFTTAKKLKAHGRMERIWEEVQAPEDDDQDEEEDDED